MIDNISFIVVARNEEFALAKCLRSIAGLPLDNCEVICVDSNSTDGTLDVMRRYAAGRPEFRICQCRGYVNSAIARNAGLQRATRKYIFFVDGDVELNEGFLRAALPLLQTGEADMVTGKLAEVYYAPGYRREVRRVDDRRQITAAHRIWQTGGIFLARAALVATAGRFDERFDRNEDLEFTLRLSRHGRCLAIPVAMGTHHTLEYPERGLQFLKKRYPMYFGMLIRRNLDRPAATAELIGDSRGYWMGVLLTMLMLLGVLAARAGLVSESTAIATCLSILLADVGQALVRRKPLLGHLASHYLYWPMILAGVLFDANRKRPPTEVVDVAVEREIAAPGAPDIVLLGHKPSFQEGRPHFATSPPRSNPSGFSDSQARGYPPRSSDLGQTRP